LANVKAISFAWPNIPTDVQPEKALRVETFSS